MAIGDSPIIKIIAVQFKVVSSFFDMAYRQGWLMYLILILIIGFIWIVFFQ